MQLWSRVWCSLTDPTGHLPDTDDNAQNTEKRPENEQWQQSSSPKCSGKKTKQNRVMMSLDRLDSGGGGGGCRCAGAGAGEDQASVPCHRVM